MSVCLSVRLSVCLSVYETILNNFWTAWAILMKFWKSLKLLTSNFLGHIWDPGVPRVRLQGPYWSNLKNLSPPTVFAQSWWDRAYFKPWTMPKKVVHQIFEFLPTSKVTCVWKVRIFRGTQNSMKTAFFSFLIEKRPPLEFNFSGGLFYAFCSGGSQGHAPGPHGFNF